jgi:ATP-dependent RNA helicase DDX21
VEPKLEEDHPTAVMDRMPLSAVAANLEAVLPIGEDSPLGSADIVEELLGDAPEGFSRSPRSFASLFTDDEAEETAEVDPSLLLVNCGLSEGSVKALEQRGITSLFAIQKSVFEPAMRGADLIARAKTGSGEHDTA